MLFGGIFKKDGEAILYLVFAAFPSFVDTIPKRTRSGLFDYETQDWVEVIVSFESGN